MNLEISLPSYLIEYAVVSGSDHDCVSVMIGIDASAERQFGAGLRLLAQKHDPQDGDAELARARQLCENIEELIAAVRTVSRYRPERGRATVLDASIDHLELMAIRVEST